ncbi:hypothetical protein [Ferrovibrio sp.]|uniref:hypothetical protein n=1 Tax=Ferrovibrio sp. TaxID=1917215 RepID=UPI0035B2E54A
MTPSKLAYRLVGFTVVVCAAAAYAFIYAKREEPPLKIGDCLITKREVEPALLSRGSASLWFSWPSMTLADVKSNLIPENIYDIIGVDITESKYLSHFPQQLARMIRDGGVHISHEHGMWAYHYRGTGREPFFFMSVIRHDTEETITQGGQQDPSLLRCHQLLSPTNEATRILSCTGYFPLSASCSVSYNFRPDIQADDWSEIQPSIMRKLASIVVVQK